MFIAKWSWAAYIKTLMPNGISHITNCLPRTMFLLKQFGRVIHVHVVYDEDE